MAVNTQNGSPLISLDLHNNTLETYHFETYYKIMSINVNIMYVYGKKTDIEGKINSTTCDSANVNLKARFKS